MSRTIMVVLCSLALACGESGTGTGGTGGTGGDGGSGCDLVTQTGCSPGEKCAVVILQNDPLDTDIQCVADGDKAKGDACEFGPEGDTGFDDCVGGLVCGGAECVEMCVMSPDSCPAGDACVGVGDLLDDQPGTGVCEFQCNALTQDCPGDDGCYVNFIDDPPETVCASAQGGGQGDDCMFINSCDEGFGCVLITSPSNTDLTCAEFCLVGGGEPSCGGGFTCTEINEFYGDVDGLPTDLGMCVPDNFNDL